MDTLNGYYVICSPFLKYSHCPKGCLNLSDFKVKYLFLFLGKLLVSHKERGLYTDTSLSNLIYENLDG